MLFDVSFRINATGNIYGMKNIKITVSILLFTTTLFYGLILSAAGGEHGSEQAAVQNAVISEKSACDVSDDTLRFLSPGWQEAHKGLVEAGKLDGCDRKQCYACHISAAPHDFSAHQSKYKEDSKSCLSCHDYDSCNECHQAFRAHGGNKDFLDHGKFLEKSMSSSCKQCHSVDWCNKCHTEKGVDLLTNHSPNFRQMHPVFLPKKQYKEKIESCTQCHGQKFCIQCHENQGKDVHPYKWYVGHGRRMSELAAGAKPGEMDRCLDCHKTGFCSTCHKSSGLVRTAHEPNWVETHKSDPKSKSPMCVSCHTPGYCSRCHDISLPHSAEFAADHKKAVLEKPDTCKSCHEPSFCATCHTKKLKPASHTPVEWYKSHNKMAGKSKDYCTTCHSDKKFCGWCHETSTMKVTHTPGWKEKHADTTNMSELKGCAYCHDKSSCDEKCHKDIEDKANVSARPDHRICSNCHVDDKWTFAGSDACVKCHKDATHQNDESKHAGDCTDCHTAHKWKIPKKGNTCASAACHKPYAEEVAKIKDHVSDNCSSCHKPHDWGDKSNFDVCGDCHKIDEYDKNGIKALHLTGAHQMCGDCHDAHNGTVNEPDSCLRCHEKLPDVCDPDKLCTDCHKFK